MMKKCKNLVSAILLTACSLVTITGMAQNTTSTLPKNAKWVSVEYPTYGYTIRGYVYKKQFVEGQELEITQGELKITGVYKVENGTPIVRGKRVRSNSETVEGGVFQVSNDVEGKQLIPHVKKANGLSDVNLLDFSVYSGKYSSDVPLTIQKISDDNYEVSMNFATRKIKSRVNQSKAIFIIRSKQLTGEQGEIFYTNGDVYSGKIYDDGEIYLKGKIHVPNEGVTKFADGTEVKGDWLAEYNFPEKTWKEIYTNSRYKYPTEIRDLAIAKQKELEEQEKARLLSEQEKNKLKNYVDDYIKKHTIAPAPPGEFETTEEWQERTYKEKDKQKRKLMDEALRKLYGDNPFHEKIRLRLGQYNIDKRYFPMTTNGFGTYALSVDREAGAWWREQWNTGKFSIRNTYEYGLVNGELRLVYLAAVDRWDEDIEIYPIDEKTGKIYEFIWEDGVWKEKKEDEEDYEDEKIYEVVETMPSFNGNMSKWLRDKVKYPKLAQENGISGRVFVAFVVEVDGSITDVKIARSVDPSLDKEAVRVVKAMPKWNPGKLKGGKPVRVAFTVPINFTLSN